VVSALTQLTQSTITIITPTTITAAAIDFLLLSGPATGAGTVTGPELKTWFEPESRACLVKTWGSGSMS
jgi:hypothetical protein